MVDAVQTQIAEIVEEEIKAGGYPFPFALISSLIQVESGWKPGIVNPQSGAMGLMQIMPAVLKDYNKAHAQKFTNADMQGTSLASSRAQIKVGLWILGVFWRGAYQYLQPKIFTVPVDELVRIADLFYVAGPSATKKKLALLSTPTYAAITARFPTWVALNHSEKVWNWTDAKNPVWDLTAIDNWVRKGTNPLIAGFDGHLGGFVVGALVLVLGWYLLSKGKTYGTESA
jgi:Transglycosylase SLT domain